MSFETYLSLLPPWFRLRPRFAALASALLKQSVDLFNLLESLPTAYNLSTAVGTQLDALGSLVGVPRPASTTATISRPGVPLSAVNTPHPASTTATISRPGVPLSAVNVPCPASTTTDGDYRELLRARIACHTWDGCNDTLPSVLSLAFPARTATLNDTQNGRVTVALSGTAPAFSLSELFPYPAGILLQS